MSETVKILAFIPLAFLLVACSSDDAPTPDAATVANLSPPSAVVRHPAQIEQTVGELFNFHCLPCHADGPGFGGTMRLAQRLGPEKSLILERDDLEVEYVKTVIRQGVFMMPPFRPAEISDAELLALAEFVVAQGKAHAVNISKTEG